MNSNLIAITYTRILAHQLKLNGVALSSILRGTDLCAGDIYGDQAFITLDQQYKIVENAVALSTIPCPGLTMGTGLDLAQHGLIGIAALSSATLLNALQVLTKFYMIRAPFLQIAAIEQGDRLIIEFKNRDELHEPVSHFLMEAMMGMLQAICEQITCTEMRDGRVIFSYPKPPHHENYSRAFHSPVIFKEQEYCQYSIPLSAAKTPLLTKDRKVKEQAEQVCDEALSKINHNASYSEKVVDLLCIDDGNLLSLLQISQRLNLSQRSLIRKLKQENTSYQMLRESEQQRLAIEHLKNKKLSIEAIAIMLGYGYVANFRRAFRRWFGVTPSEFRQQLNEDKET